MPAFHLFRPLSVNQIEYMFDDVLDALAAPERRRLLFALLAAEPRAAKPVTSDDAAGGGRPLAIHHVHLPKLADYGFVDWDRESGVVRTGPNFAEIRPLLELLIEHAEELPDGWVEPVPGTTPDWSSSRGSRSGTD